MKKAAIAILFSQDRHSILIIKRSDVPLWTLPGGGIDENESPEAAATRELFEETGIDATIVRKIGTYFPINRLSQETHVFECTSLLQTPLPSEETIEVQFAPLNQLPTPFFFLHKEWIDDALQNHPTPLQQPIRSITWLNLLKQLCLHPYLMLRYFLARFGFPINSRAPYNRRK